MSRLEAYVVVHTCARNFLNLEPLEACSRGELFDISLVVEIYRTSAQAIAESAERCSEPMFTGKGNNRRQLHQGPQCDQKAARICNVIHNPHNDHVIVNFKVDPRKRVFD